MKLLLAIILALALVSCNPCDELADYVMQCNHTAEEYIDGLDTSVLNDYTCEVLVNTGGVQTCSEYCEDNGATCVIGQDNVGGDSCQVEHNKSDRELTFVNNGCEQVFSNQMCTCQIDVDPCEGYTGYAQQCDHAASEFLEGLDSEVVNSPTACEVLVNTSKSTCNDYCESQGRVCVLAQDNVNSDCTLEPDSTRDLTFEENGCTMTWNNQICVCDEPQDEDSCLDDPENDPSDVEADEECAILYTECDYQGESFNLCKQNPDIATIKSVQVPEGKVLTLYDEQCFNGQTAEFSESVACLDNVDFTDFIQLQNLSINLLANKEKITVNKQLRRR